MALHHASAKIAFIGQFPPPINGLTFITSRLELALKQAGYDILARNTTGKLGSRNLLFHLSRLLHTLRALLTIGSLRLSGKSQVCYLTADGGLGLTYSILIAAWARLLGFRLFIHHHSYSYIVRPRTLMTCLLAVSGSEAVHICLCSEMAQDLANCYGRNIRSLTISNATFVDPGKSASPFSTRRDLVIGLIGNLTPDKGLYEFIEIVRIAKARGLPIRGVLAGPIVRDSDRIVLQSLKDELGEHLDYRGPVYHAEKARFFENIDVFVFPTTYLNEAQPTVIFEALANSVPIISFDRGCIRNQVGNAGCVFRGDANFVVEALLALDVYCGDPAVLAMHQHAARARYEVDRRAGNVQIAQLFDATPSQVRPLSMCESQEAGYDTAR